MYEYIDVCLLSVFADLFNRLRDHGADGFFLQEKGSKKAKKDSSKTTPTKASKPGNRSRRCIFFSFGQP